MNAPTPFLDLPDLPDVRPGEAAGSFTAQLSIQDYHSIRDYISHSGMCELLRSPAHYATYLNGRGDRDGKINFGSAAHCAVLEPEEFAKQYVVYEGRRAGKAYESFVFEHPGASILNTEEHDRINGIINSLMQFQDFPIFEALRAGESEKSIFWINSETGAPCRVRIDSLNRFAIFDLKTLDDVRPENVERQIMRMDYDLQGYMYTNGVHAFSGDHLPFNYIFVEDKPPHGVWLYTSGATLLASGREKFLRGAKAFVNFGQANLLQCYPGAFSVIEAPQWRRRELAQMVAESVVPAAAEDKAYL